MYLILFTAHLLPEKKYQKTALSLAVLNKFGEAAFSIENTAS